MENSDQIPQDLLADEASPYLQYVPATTGQRFLNYLIDNIVMRYTITYLTGYPIAVILAYLFPEAMRDVAADENKTMIFLIGCLIAIFNYLIYYTLLEKLFKGKTLGKFLTKTRAVRLDGGELTFKDAFFRSACRLIPFEPFSGFGIPWHDHITDTVVIRAD